VTDYAHRVKLEIARQLLGGAELSVEDVASRCGFQDARQLRRLWKKAHGTSPAQWKAARRGAESAGARERAS
jgi:transcriptional regulator GlxA family with amidase domain